MICSPQSVRFRQNESTQIIHMQNTSTKALIFKQVKVTHTNYFLISPPKGIIKEAEKASLTIRPIKNCNINAKLQINYAQLEQNLNQSIDIQLEKVSKQDIKSIIIPITCAFEPLKEEKKEEKPLFKKTDSPIYQIEIESQQKIQSKDKSKKCETSLKRSVLKSNSIMFKSVQDLDKKQSNSMSRNEVSRLQKELQYQRQLNKRMTERLLQRQKKIMYYNSMRQLQVNKSLQNEENAMEWSCCNSILLAFICIMVGFFLSKYDLPTPTL